VPSIIEPYLIAFEEAANARGMDLVIDDIVVSFGSNLELDGVEAAGLCNFETETTAASIELDTMSENWLAHESSREILIFHELGHCVLNRGHINATLPASQYKSVMKATGEPVYANFCNFKKDYYLDELFDVSTSAPDWANFEYEAIPNSLKTPLLVDEFDDNSNNWIVGQGEVNLQIENGIYRLNNNSTGPRIVSQQKIINSNANFEIEMGMRIVDGGEFVSGIYWGSRDPFLDFPAKLLYFGYNSEKLCYLFDSPSANYVAHPSGEIRNNEFNKISIRRADDLVYIFINETPHDVMTYQEFYDNRHGIIVSANTTIEVDYFRIYELQN